MPQVRLAARHDLEQYLRLFVEVAGEGLWLGAQPPVDEPQLAARYVERLASDDATVLLAGSPALGWLTVELRHGVGRVGMGVAGAARGSGIGRSLLQEGISWCRRAGAHKVDLDVWPHNYPARALYSSAGFVEEGRRRRHWERRDDSLWDSVVMGLVLDEERPGGPSDSEPPPRPLPVPAGGIPVTGVHGRLRPWHARDVGDLVSAMQSSDIRRWLPGLPDPYGAGDGQAWIAAATRACTEGAGAHLALVDESGVLGGLGVRLAPGDSGSAAMGWWLAPWARGRGLATAAASSLAAWAVSALCLGRLECLVDPANAASHRVAEGAGFALEGRRRAALRGVPTRADALCYVWPEVWSPPPTARAPSHLDARTAP